MQNYTQSFTVHFYIHKLSPTRTHVSLDSSLDMRKKVHIVIFMRFKYTRTHTEQKDAEDETQTKTIVSIRCVVVGI